MSSKPKSPSRRAPKAPELLRKVAQWVLWRYEERDGKRTKVPISAIDGRRASTTDPSTWTSWETAVLALRRFRDCEGLGFVFAESDGFSGIDLDDCVTESGDLEPWAQSIIDRIATYAEKSPSGRGVKLFLIGKLPPGRRRKGQVEMYESGRFFTVTGRHLPGTPTTVEQRQAELEALHAEILGGDRELPKPAPQRRSPPAIADDVELLARARAARNGAKFSALFDQGDTGGHDGDDSAADLALCSHLVFWTGGDIARVDRLFRRSALMRPKWDSRRGQTTYGAITIHAALRTATSFYEPQTSLTASGDAPRSARWRHLTTHGASGRSRRGSVASLAGHLLRRGIDPFVTLDLLRSWNVTKCRPPLPDAEVIQIADEVAGRERQRRSQRA